MAKVPLAEQIAALELVLANRKGFVDTLRGLVRSKKRPPEELEIAERPVPGLEAAVKTLKWVQRNEMSIKKALSSQESS